MPYFVSYEIEVDGDCRSYMEDSYDEFDTYEELIEWWGKRIHTAKRVKEDFKVQFVFDTKSDMGSLFLKDAQKQAEKLQIEHEEKTRKAGSAAEEARKAQSKRAEEAKAEKEYQDYLKLKEKYENKS